MNIKLNAKQLRKESVKFKARLERSREMQSSRQSRGSPLAAKLRKNEIYIVLDNVLD